METGGWVLPHFYWVLAEEDVYASS